MPAINLEPKAFSLLVYTGQPLPARLFPKKTRTTLHSRVKRRSEMLEHSQVISER